MSKALERREKLRADLILAAERTIASRGLAGLKTRDLAREIGCANGAVYNLVADVDELILRVGSRTLLRLDEALSAAESAGEPSPLGDVAAFVWNEHAASTTAASTRISIRVRGRSSERSRCGRTLPQGFLGH